MRIEKVTIILRLVVIPIIGCLSLLLDPTPSLAQSDYFDAWNQLELLNQEQYLEDQLIITLSSASSPEALGLLHQEINSEVLGVNIPLGLQIVKINNLTLKEAIEHYSQSEHVVNIELDQVTHLSGTVDDTYFISDDQWALEDIHAPEAWDISTGLGVTIAILDSGADSDHEDLVGNLVSGYNFVDNNTNTDDVVCGHGTMVSGIAAAVGNNATGLAGVAYHASIMPVKILDNSCNGSVSNIVSGITYAVDNGADLINLSVGVYGATSSLESAVNYAENNNVLIVTSANNSSEPYESNNWYPALYPSTLVVTSHDQSDEVYSTSNVGGNVVSAPGVSIRTTYNNGSYGYFSLTSASAPIVVGVAALIKSANSNLTGNQLCWLIKNEATDIGDTGRDFIFGYGKVDAEAAVAQANNDSYSYPSSGCEAEVTPTYGWVIEYGGENIDNDLEGNLYLSSDTSSTLGYTKYSPNGDLIFEKDLGTGGSNHDIFVDDTGVTLLTGEYSAQVDFNASEEQDTKEPNNVDLFITKYKADGSYGWTRTAAGASSAQAKGYGVTADQNGNITAVGEFRQTVDFDDSAGVDEHSHGSSWKSIFITHYDSDSNYLWTKSLVPQSYVYSAGLDVITDSSNNIIVVGTFGSTVDFDPGESEVIKDGGSKLDGFIVSFQEDGVFSWAKSFGNSSESVWVNAVTVDESNNVYTTGYFGGTVDFNDSGGVDEHIAVGDKDVFITKYSSSGEYGWTRTFGGSGEDLGNDLAVSTDGRVLVVGTYENTVDFDTSAGEHEFSSYGGYSDIFISTHTTEGVYISTDTYGGGRDDTVTGIALDTSNNYVIVGEYRGAVDFSNDDTNYFLSSAWGRYTSKYAIDQTSPGLSVTETSPGTDTTPVLSGTSSESSGITFLVEYQIDSTEGAWTTCTAVDGSFEESIEEFSCQVENPLSGGVHTAYFRATDGSGNTTPLGSYTESLFTIDFEGPIKSIFTSHDQDGYINTRDVLLNISATDEISNVAYMMLSESEAFADASWQTYSSSTQFSVSEGDGVKRIYIKFKDDLDNESSTSYQDVIIDTKAPHKFSFQTQDRMFKSDSGKHVVRAVPNGGYTVDNEVALSWKNESDATSGVDKYEVYYREIGDRKWELVEEVEGTEDVVVLEVSVGDYEWYVIAHDIAGNTRETDIYTFYVIDSMGGAGANIHLVNGVSPSSGFVYLGVSEILDVEGVADKNSEVIVEIYSPDGAVKYQEIICATDIGGEFECKDQAQILSNYLLRIYSKNKANEESAKTEINLVIGNQPQLARSDNTKTNIIEGEDEQSKEQPLLEEDSKEGSSGYEVDQNTAADTRLGDDKAELETSNKPKEPNLFRRFINWLNPFN